MNNLILNLNYNLLLKIKKKKFPNYKILYKWINIILKKFFNNITITININLVPINIILKLNSIYYKNNKITDVLSFRYNFFLLKKHLFLGDIIICHDVLLLQSYNKSINIIIIYARIIVHSILHLINYNHNNKQNANIMFKLERKLLIKLGF